ncbi:MAG: ATP-binding cassette domain-containing protein [Bacteroidia bacterium]
MLIFSSAGSVLSGGQQKRLALAKVLLDEADFVIMDEPTNHLDLDMIEWLESFLTTANMTMLLVTHDRYFLDEICDEILELDNGTLYRHKGNYSYYLEKKPKGWIMNRHLRLVQKIFIGQNWSGCANSQEQEALSQNRVLMHFMKQKKMPKGKQNRIMFTRH